MQTPEMLLQWIRLRTKPVAVFYEDDKFYPMSVQTRRFVLMFADFPQGLMGVYTKECSLEWLAEDMEYMRHHSTVRG